MATVLDLGLLSFFMPFLLILRTLGFRVNVVVHGVVIDVFELAGHLGIKDNFIGKIKQTPPSRRSPRLQVKINLTRILPPK